jgi:hypothetical protein
MRKLKWASLLCGGLLLPASGALQAQDEPYSLGRGLALRDWLTVGGYFSTEYARSDNQHELLLDDLALLLYGEKDRVSYLLEIESVAPYVADFENDTTDTNFPPTLERLYVDYKFSDQFALRLGKQITPVGYWNLQPINVLRETTSNPLFSTEVFPKFLTGADLHGYLPFGRDLTYHVFAQDSRDMDEANINIRINRHFGFALEQPLQGGWHAGGSYGSFRMTTGDETRYLQLNSRYDGTRFSFITEGALSVTRHNTGASHRASAVYAQGEFRFTAQHALITRAEFRHDRFDVTGARRIGVLGYSYRPVYPVSLKIEHQWHDDSSRNAVMASFSVLF